MSSSGSLPAAVARASEVVNSTASSAVAMTSAAVDDEAERAVLWLKVSDVRAVLSRQQRSIARLRSKLAGVADRKAPLIAWLQAELSSQQNDISALRAQLAAQQAVFAADEDSAHSVYEAALRAIEANSRSAVTAAESEVSALLQSSNELASFALVEAALHSKCSQLARKNADNEAKHKQRMADMRREWDVSRAQLKEAASRARHDSERRYKQQVMAAINISYTRMSEEIATMQYNKQSEVMQLGRLHDDIQQCRQAISAEKERERGEHTQRANSQRSLFDVRLQLRQVKRDIGHEEDKLEVHRLHEAQRQQQWQADTHTRRRRLECELSEWRAVRAVYERSVRRVQRVVSDVEAARNSNSFQQLVEECMDDIRRDTHYSPHNTNTTVAAMSDETRQRMLRLLFARIRQAETERQCRQQQQSVNEQSIDVADGAVGAVGHASLQINSVVVVETAAVHTGPSFFLTQHQSDETEEPSNVAGS